jgi:hypothetical protein
MHHDTFFTLVKILMGVMLLAAIGSTWYNYDLMQDCINSGSPNSQACFKYNVVNNNLRNNNVNLNFNQGE